MKTLIATTLIALFIGLSAQAQIVTTTHVSCVGDDLSLIDLTSHDPFDAHYAQVTDAAGKTTLNLSDEIKTINMISATGGDKIEVLLLNNEVALALVNIGRAGKRVVEEITEGDYTVITKIKIRGQLRQKNKEALSATCEYTNTTVSLSGIGDSN